MSEESNITRDQLKLLMGSYRESIELNFKLLGKLDNVLDSQKKSCSGIDKLCDKINDQTSTLVAHNIKLGDELIDIKVNIIRDHNSIKNKLYLAFTMMGSIILGLITTIYKLFTP